MSPYALLPAPRIAGLLCAPKPVTPTVDALHLHEARLDQLTTLEFARVFAAFRQLLTAALDFTLGDSLSAELYAAEQAFHETLTGETAPPRTHARDGLKKRLDAFWKESEARMAAAEVRLAARMEALQRQYNIVPEAIDVKPQRSPRQWDGRGEGGEG
jgi:hypothetical protein